MALDKEEKVYETLSEIPLKLFYSPADISDKEYPERLNDPGLYPYTRGIHPDMYRGKPWTMRMFAGFGTPEDTNNRFKYLLKQGQTGLSTAFDMPTLMGYDPDHAMSLGEVGKEGVSIASLPDMMRLFDGIPLDQVSTSMTINAPAIIVLAFYIATAENQGVSSHRLRGTTQNDILKEFIAQKEWICPIKPAMRIIRDMIAFSAKNLPQWNTISISGYHIREAGATAVQELAFTLADGIGYVQAGLDAGLNVDEFAPRLSFFFDVHNDFFEEIAKFRAARRLWARILKERFQAKNPRSLLLRTHAQTAGVSLTAQQPYNNIVRTTLQALAAVLGGTQSLHTNSMDETYALPTEEAATIALRTQQIIAEESHVAQVVDPLGGSYFVEKLTDEMEARAEAYLKKIDQLGGIIEAIEKGYPQMEIAESAYRFQKKVERGDEVIVGLNKYQGQTASEIPTLRIEKEVEEKQKERIVKLKKHRNHDRAMKSLDKLKSVAKTPENIFPFIIAAVKDEVTLGEISDLFREVYGRYRDPGYF